MSSTSIPPVDPASVAWNNYINAQSFNVTGLDGTPVTISFPDIDSLAYERVTNGTVAGFAIGFCAQLFIVLVILTPSNRRRLPIYILNMTSLFLLVFLNICRAVVYSASYQNAGPQLLHAGAGYGKSTWVPIVIASVLQPFLFASIMASLVLQTRVVFAAEPKARKIVSILLALAALVEFGIATTNSAYQILLQYSYPSIVVVPQWIYRTMRLYFLVFVAVCCVVLLYKLARTIYRRRKMGLDAQHFGPLQIIFVMFTQCLIVPLVIYILDYTLQSRSVYVIIAQVALVSSLPLSALWASSDHQHSPHSRPHEKESSSTISASVRRSGFNEFRSKWSARSARKDSSSDTVERTPSDEAEV